MTALFNFVCQDSKAWSLYVPTAINYQSSGKNEYRRTAHWRAIIRG
jgi:hypothetical protein